jgi:hypothetical protein
VHPLHRSGFGLAGVVLAGVLGLASSGCGGGTANHPTVYPVTGVVVFKDGTPLNEGAIQFEPQSGGKDATTLGEIDADGEFTLHTLHQNDNLPGAPEGNYKVTILSRRTEKQEQQTYQPAQVFRVEAKENRFRIEIDGPRKK